MVIEHYMIVNLKADYADYVVINLASDTPSYSIKLLCSNKYKIQFDVYVYWHEINELVFARNDNI